MEYRRGENRLNAKDAGGGGLVNTLINGQKRNKHQQTLGYHEEKADAFVRHILYDWERFKEVRVIY